jgi:hypothetical protein
MCRSPNHTTHALLCCEAVQPGCRLALHCSSRRDTPECHAPRRFQLSPCATTRCRTGREPTQDHFGLSLRQMPTTAGRPGSNAAAGSDPRQPRRSTVSPRPRLARRGRRDRDHHGAAAQKLEATRAARSATVHPGMPDMPPAAGRASINQLLTTRPPRIDLTITSVSLRKITSVKCGSSGANYRGGHGRRGRAVGGAIWSRG